MTDAEEAVVGPAKGELRLATRAQSYKPNRCWGKIKAIVVNTGVHAKNECTTKPLTTVTRDLLHYRHRPRRHPQSPL